MKQPKTKDIKCTRNSCGCCESRDERLFQKAQLAMQEIKEALNIQDQKEF